LRPQGDGLSRAWGVGVDARADAGEHSGEHVDFLGRDVVEEEAADDIALDEGGLVEELLAGLGQEDEALLVDGTRVTLRVKAERINVFRADAETTLIEGDLL